MWEIPVLLLIYMLLEYFQKFQKAVPQTTENGDGIRPNMFEETGKEEISQNIIQLTEEMSAKLTDERTKANQKEKESLKVTKERGKVVVLEYNTLRENRVEMVNELVPEKMIPHLKENKVIDHDDVEKIEKKCKDLRRKGVETMLNIIYNSGSCAFKKLLKVLQQTGYQELAQKLTVNLEKKRTDPSSTNTTKQRGRLSGIELEVLKDNHERLVDELDSSVLKNHLFQNKLIDEDDLERITKKEEELRREGVEEMIAIIYHSGENAFLGLIKSLAEAGYEELSSKLLIDFNQKKDLVEFPDYPVIPELVEESEIETLANIKKEFEVWCFTMENWLKNHKFKTYDELKMVVWFLGLVKLLHETGYEELSFKLRFDFDQRKDLVAFPDYPVEPKLLVDETIMGTLTSIETDYEVWCLTMRDWFRIHKFKNDDELKMVVKYWLCELEEVIGIGCLGPKVANMVYGLAERLEDPDRTIFLQEIKEDNLKMTPKEDFEPKSINALLHKQQRRFFENLKHNLEGIIEGKQNFELLPIDTESCKLAALFQSVGYDVREIWNKLH